MGIMMSNQKETQTIYTTSKKINGPGTTLMEDMESERGTTLTEGMVKEHGITLMEVMENAAQNLMKKVKYQPNKVENLPLCQITTTTSHKRCCLSSLFPKNPQKSSKKHHRTTIYHHNSRHYTTIIYVLQISQKTTEITHYLQQCQTLPCLIKKCLLPILLSMTTPSSGDSTYSNTQK